MTYRWVFNTFPGDCRSCWSIDRYERNCLHVVFPFWGGPQNPRIFWQVGRLLTTAASFRNPQSMAPQNFHGPFRYTRIMSWWKPRSHDCMNHAFGKGLPATRNHVLHGAFFFSIVWIGQRNRMNEPCQWNQPRILYAVASPCCGNIFQYKRLDGISTLSLAFTIDAFSGDIFKSPSKDDSRNNAAEFTKNFGYLKWRYWTL